MSDGLLQVSESVAHLSSLMRDSSVVRVFGEDAEDAVISSSGEHSDRFIRSANVTGTINTFNDTRDAGVWDHHGPEANSTRCTRATVTTKCHQEVDVV